MSIHSLLRRLSLVAAACSILASTAPVHAAVIASFDPAFGGAINNLGFKGKITLDPSSGCNTASGYINTDPAGCNIPPLGAYVDFYNTNDSSQPNVVPRLTLDSYLSPNYVYGAFFNPTGQLVSFDSYESDPFQVSIHDHANSDTTKWIDFDGYMVLYFVSNRNDSARTFSTSAAAPAASVGGAFLRICNFVEGTSCGRGDPTDTSNQAGVTISAVPEPEVALLMLLGAGALVTTRRRRTTARH